MAAMTPLLMSTALNLALDHAQNEQAEKNLGRQNALEEKQAKADAALKKQALLEDAAADEKKRKSALRKAVASKKASFGAQGVGSSSGSSEAVLLGLISDSEDAQDESDSVTALKLAAIDQDLKQQKALNVLQRAQLKEKNSLSLIGQLL